MKHQDMRERKMSLNNIFDTTTEQNRIEEIKIKRQTNQLEKLSNRKRSFKKDEQSRDEYNET